MRCSGWGWVWRWRCGIGRVERMNTLSYISSSGNDLVHVLIQLLIVGCICWLVIWLVDKIGCPAPFNWVVKLIFVLILLMWVLNIFGVYHF